MRWSQAPTLDVRQRGPCSGPVSPTRAHTGCGIKRPRAVLSRGVRPRVSASVCPQTVARLMPSCPSEVPAPVVYSLACLCSKTPYAPWVEATDAEATIVSQHALVRPTLAAAQPASGRGPHTGCLVQDAPQDKTVAYAASAQRTIDTRPRHSAGRPHARRCRGDANRPWQ